MQAQTIRARRTIRVPWMLLVAALLIAAIAIGTGVAMARNDAPATAGFTSQTAYANGPSVRFGAVGWTVAEPSGPHGVHQQPKVAPGDSGSDSGSVATPDTNQGVGSVIGKRLP